MKKLLVVALLVIVAVAMMGSEGCDGSNEPSQDLQNRWANAACERHGGIREIDHYDGEEDPANVTCEDGVLQVQRFNGGESEHEWETPLEVHERGE